MRATDPTTEGQGARSLQDRILGALGGGMLLLAVVVLLFGGGTRDGAADAAPPAVSILAPESGQVIDRRQLALVFRPAVEIRPTPMGWGAGDLHLHVRVDQQDFMPFGSDIERLPEGRYRWTRAPLLEPGYHTLRLFWSDETHRPIEAGGSAPVRIRVRQADG